MAGGGGRESHKVGDYGGSERPFEAERARLRALAAGLNPLSRRHLERIGVGPGWRCLEIGAAEGSMCAWMAERVDAAGRVVAADIDTRFLVDAAWPGVEILELDLREGALPPAAFDLVYCRTLLLHLPDPDAALRAMHAALPPGGVLFAQEPDMCLQQAADPDHSDAERIERFFDAAYRHIRSRKLFDTRFGRSLPPRMRCLGLEDVNVEISAELVAPDSPTAANVLQTFEQAMGPLLVHDGVFGQDEVDAALAAYRDPGFELLSGVQFAVWGRKPGARRR